MALALNIAALDEELQALEKRTQMIQDIKRLTADPEGKALLERIMQNGSVPTVPTVQPPLPSGNEYTGLSQIDSVRRAIAKSGGSFVVGGIGDELRAHGIEIANTAVGRVLLRLQKAKEIRVAIEGGGNVPHQYETTETFRRV